MIDVRVIANVMGELKTNMTIGAFNPQCACVRVTVVVLCVYVCVCVRVRVCVSVITLAATYT